MIYFELKMPLIFNAVEKYLYRWSSITEIGKRYIPLHNAHTKVTILITPLILNNCGKMLKLKK